MTKRSLFAAWAQAYARQARQLTRVGVKAGLQSQARVLKATQASRKPPAGVGDWLTGTVAGAAGVRRYHLFRPAGVKFGERLPLLVMLHGCGQDARGFAASTRMNLLAARERFLVLYPEQDRLSNPQGCWNWFDTRSGRAYGEAALIMRAVDQVCVLFAADRQRVAIAGLSAGASMAALLVARYPDRFKAAMMHSGVAPGTADSTLSAISAMHGQRTPRPLPASSGAMATAWPPLLVIHGNADAVVSAQNGRDAAQTWAQAGQAGAGQERAVQRGKRYPMTVTDFKRGSALVATLVQVDGLAHAWSGGAASQPFSDSKGPDASRLAWAFAAKQFGAGKQAAIAPRARAG